MKSSPGSARLLLAARLLPACLAAWGCSPAPHEERLAAWRDRGSLPFFAAVAIGLFTHPPDPAQADEDIAAIAALGATGVVLPVLWSSADVSSTTIEPFAYGVGLADYDRAAIEIARRAHARGLAFELRPILRLEHLETGEWRGTLQPSDWSAWWNSYRRFILHHAELAESAGAEIFCIGSELGTTESNRREWSRLITAVRERYHGSVIYSANWDHYQAVEFWDLLDGIGLSAYYELSDSPSASQSQLAAAWRDHRDRILAWARPIGKPVYLTEVGYPAQARAPVHPWDYTMSDPADPEAQERCFRAFQDAWLKVPELRGVTIWIWMHGKGGLNDPSYAVAGKPAAGILKEFFGARRRAEPAPR